VAGYPALKSPKVTNLDIHYLFLPVLQEEDNKKTS